MRSTTLVLSNTMRASKPAHLVIRGSHAASAGSQYHLANPTRVWPIARSSRTQARNEAHGAWRHLAEEFLKDNGAVKRSPSQASWAGVSETERVTPPFWVLSAPNPICRHPMRQRY
ncbi:hypothetical protein EVAR_91382_1 [Eumeta japonica]|uniref:Uncharacterized protein n=1 Tax=Eumeta variegata TaxID=151549 RepID=A0A4C1XDK2_EUMVA|nr:hypothetical protein EVAR_91382_1 [Eumeta japonica]